MSIKPVSTTSGQSSPSTVAEDAGRTGGYKYRKDPDWVPGHPRYREPRPDAGPLPQNVKATTARQKRLAEFGRLLTEEKLTAKQAAERMQISASTAGYYVRELQELKEQQRREGQP